MKGEEWDQERGGAGREEEKWEGLSKRNESRRVTKQREGGVGLGRVSRW